jgi:hypothetical protein
MISPDTRQNVTRLRTRQDSNFRQQIMTAITWDISALDFVDKNIGKSLRDLIMKIESRQKPGQQLFHAVDETWNHNYLLDVYFYFTKLDFHIYCFPVVHKCSVISGMPPCFPFIVDYRSCLVLRLQRLSLKIASLA